jgi:hypothetical protein
MRERERVRKRESLKSCEHVQEARFRRVHQHHQRRSRRRAAAETAAAAQIAAAPRRETEQDSTSM